MWPQKWGHFLASYLGQLITNIYYRVPRLGVSFRPQDWSLEFRKISGRGCVEMVSRNTYAGGEQAIASNQHGRDFRVYFSRLHVWKHGNAEKKRPGAYTMGEQS